MKQVRISKYNPIYRNGEGKYDIEDWTSISDVGKVYDGNVFKMKDYELVEERYISCILDILNECNIQELYLTEYECYDVTLSWINRQRIPINQIPDFSKDCLRERCWGKLSNSNIFIHFGYDYYMYIGCNLSIDTIRIIAGNSQLFCELQQSPYL